ALQEAMHGRGLLQIRGNLGENSFLGLRRFERQNAFQRFAHTCLANAKGDARAALPFFPAQRQAQLVKEKLLEDQAAVRRRAKLVQRLQGHVCRGKMDKAKGVGAAGKTISREQRRGQSIEGNRGKILQSAIDKPPQDTRADVADRFIDRHDAAHLGGIGSVCAKQLALRIDHFNPARTARIEIRFAVYDHGLADAEASLHIGAVKKFAGQAPRRIPNDQVEDSSSAPRKARNAGIGDGAMNGVRASRSDLLNVVEANAILIAKRQVKQQIGDRMNAPIRQRGRALRANALEIFHFSRGSYIHSRPIYTIASVDLRACIRAKLYIDWLAGASSSYSICPRR